MILVDTSVWVEYFRNGNAGLSDLLAEESVLLHPFVLGELACGNLKARAATIALLSTLPKPRTATDSEVLGLIDAHRLYGRGVGWTDAHLLASALLFPCALWTLDARLAIAARGLDISTP